MDSETQFLNEYLNHLANQYKQLSIEKLTLTVHQSVLQRRIDELTKTNEELNKKIAELSTEKIEETTSFEN